MEPRPLCQMIGELTHRIFDPRVIATAPSGDAAAADADGDGLDESNLQSTLNKVTMRIVYRGLRENTFAAIFRLLQVSAEGFALLSHAMHTL